MRRRLIHRAFVVMIVLVVAAAGAAAFGQDFLRRREPAMDIPGNEPYNGKLRFVRIQYNVGFNGFTRRGSYGEPPWAHDYPTADTHVMKIIDELTLARPDVDVSNVHRFSDPELHNYPLAYVSEPGFWTMDDAEVAGLRSYLLKGGFIIFDDFRDMDWYNLEEQMRRAMPDHYWMELDPSHPIFHSFFEIQDLKMLESYSGNPTYWGLFEDNDRSKRLMAIANRDSDHGEYWEFSDTGYLPVDLSNQAYKFGVNYVIYALTH